MRIFSYICISFLSLYLLGCSLTNGPRKSDHPSLNSLSQGAPSKDIKKKSDDRPATLEQKPAAVVKHESQQNPVRKALPPVPAVASSNPDVTTGPSDEGMNQEADNGSDAIQENDDTDSPVIAKTAEDGQGLLDKALSLCEKSQEFWADGNPEKAIDCLDHAYTLILDVQTDDDPKLIQQKEDIRFMISKRILEIYSSRFTAVSGNHDEIPLNMNRYVEAEIKSFQTIERNYFVESFKRSGRYRADIVKMLTNAGLPEELSWLPLIESGFKVNALSTARALGIWQFIPSTGYKYGLKRDTWIDERMDPKKATAAAIDYLKELHQIFGDWTTVLAAYNCGEGTVLRVIGTQKINYLDNFWDLYEKLPRETARYVPRFLATLHILKDPGKYGFTLDEIEAPLPYETVTIQKPVQLKAVAMKIGVDFEDLTALNPELRYQATSDSSYSLKVPPQKGELLLAKLDEIPQWSPPKKEYVYHRVKRGETLTAIARKYRTSVRLIVQTNHLKRSIAKAGQTLKIPVGYGNRV